MQKIFLEFKKKGKLGDKMKNKEEIYASAIDELETGNFQKGLWAMAFSEAMGDENKAKAIYIKLRTEKEFSKIDKCLDLSQAHIDDSISENFSQSEKKLDVKTETSETNQKSDISKGTVRDQKLTLSIQFLSIAMILGPIFGYFALYGSINSLNAFDSFGVDFLYFRNILWTAFVFFGFVKIVGGFLLRQRIREWRLVKFSVLCLWISGPFAEIVYYVIFSKYFDIENSIEIKSTLNGSFWGAIIWVAIWTFYLLCSRDVKRLYNYPNFLKNPL